MTTTQDIATRTTALAALRCMLADRCYRGLTLVCKDGSLLPVESGRVRDGKVVFSCVTSTTEGPHEDEADGYSTTDFTVDPDRSVEVRVRLYNPRANVARVTAELHARHRIEC